MLGTQMLRLMTWKRKCPRIFPYGQICLHIVSSSIVPVFVTIFLLETPTIAIIIDTLHRQLLTVALPIIILLLNITTLIVMAILIFTNPGILPQNVNNYEWHQSLHELPSLNHNLISDRNYLTIMPSGLSIAQKYCIQCHIYRPVRTIHCRICNHCVERYDHHCPWIGMCVGKNNYQYFFIFLTLINLLIVLVIITALIVIIQQAKAGKNVKYFVLEIIVGVMAVAFELGLLKLFFYHLELLWSGLTTNQDLKETYRVINEKVPFSRCHPTNKPQKVEEMKMFRTKDVEMEYENRLSDKEKVAKGKRYSTLVSGRDSVLNSLVESPL